MKYSMIPRNVVKFSMAALMMMVGFTACDDDKDILPVDREAQIGVLNLLDDVAAVNVHLDDEKINSTTIQQGTFSPYLVVDAGQNPLTVFAAGETDTLVSVSHDFKVNESFSAFVLGTEADAELVIVGDNLSAPATGKAKIRFANFAADTENLELWAGAGESALVGDVDFKSVKSFVEVDAAADLVLRVRSAGEEEILAELENVNLQAGKIYTAYVSVVEEEGADTLVLRLITNK